MEELGEGLREMKGITILQKDQQLVLTTMDPWELPDTKPPTKEHTWAGLRPQVHM